LHNCNKKREEIIETLIIKLKRGNKILINEIVNGSLIYSPEYAYEKPINKYLEERKRKFLVLFLGSGDYCSI